MKQYLFALDGMILGCVEKPIRSKADVINLLLKTIKHISLVPQSKEEDIAGNPYVIICIDKMSRAFFV